MVTSILLYAITFFSSPILDASVYIKIIDRKYVSHGSGSIIGSTVEKDEKTFNNYIITASHLFSDPYEEIKVSVFENNQEKEYKGEVLLKTKHGSTDQDLALLKIVSEKSFPQVTVASADYSPKAGDQVIQIGCPNGEKPPKPLEDNPVITALNRYLGAENIECSVMPIEGRSGGGLFNQLCQLIGVCSVREPSEKKGIYTSFKEIRKLLAGTQFAFLIKDTNPTFITVDIFSEQNQNIELTSINNETIKLSSLKNKIIFINLWNTWCGPCVGEMASMQNLFNEVKNDNLIFLFISDEDHETLRDFLKSRNLTLPTYIITKGKLPLSREVVPMTYIIYKNGRTVYKFVGSAIWDTSEIKSFLKELSN